MINYIVRCVRGWSSFVRFMIVATTAVFILSVILHGFLGALPVLASGVTILAVGELVTPPVTNAMFLWLHGRRGVPMYCAEDDRPSPTALAWHRAIIGMAFVFVFDLALASMMYIGTIASLLTVTAMFLVFWSLPFVGMPLLLDVLHYLGHRRHYLKELAALEQERELERAAAEAERTDQRFWGVVRDSYPKPGTEGVA